MTISSTKCLLGNQSFIQSCLFCWWWLVGLLKRPIPGRRGQCSCPWVERSHRKYWRKWVQLTDAHQHCWLKIIGEAFGSWVEVGKRQKAPLLFTEEKGQGRTHWTHYIELAPYARFVDIASLDTHCQCTDIENSMHVQNNLKFWFGEVEIPQYIKEMCMLEFHYMWI